MIWRLLLYRPTTISPDWVRYYITKEYRVTDHSEYLIYHSRIGPLLSADRCKQEAHQRYGYLWDELRQTRSREYSHAEPEWMKYEPTYCRGYHWRDVSERVTNTIITEQMSRQADYISHGKALPFDLSKDLGTQVGCEVVWVNIVSPKSSIVWR